MIDYQNIADSINFYEELGYKRIESPWLVPVCIDNITKPTDKNHYMLKHNDKCLVASGEQSFLYLYMKDFLPKGRFQTVTPCFRDERFDMTHGKYFIKNELIITDNPDLLTLEEIIQNAFKFYESKIDKDYLTIIKTDIGYDINFKNDNNVIELGSYGIRECNFLKWIYGTGCAEPRLSNVLKILL